MDLLVHTVGEELKQRNAPELVVFLGPYSRVDERVPQQLAGELEHGGVRFFYLEIKQPVTARMVPEGRNRRVRMLEPDEPMRPGRGRRDGPLSAAFPDSIEQFVKRLKGRTIAVVHPSDLARALTQL